MSALPEHVWLITVDGEWPVTVVADDGFPTGVALAWERRRASANVIRDEQVHVWHARLVDVQQGEYVPGVRTTATVRVLPASTS